MSSRDAYRETSGGTAIKGSGRDHKVEVLAQLLRVLELGPILILILLSLILSRLEPIFLTWANIHNVLGQSSVVAVLAVGSLFVIVTGGIDLSVGSVMALATVIGWFAYQHQISHAGLTVVVVMLLMGLAVGIINGIVYVKGRVPHPFIVTLAMLSLAQGVAITLAKGQPLTGMPQTINVMGNSDIGPLPASALVAGIVAIIAWWFMRWTQWGRWIYATGGNPEAAQRMSIPVSKVLISVYALSGLYAGIAGVLVAGSINGGSATLGQGAGGLLDAIAAVIIGGASIVGGRGSVWNCIAGALLIGVIRNGLALLNLSPFVEGIVVGATILLAVELDVLRNHLERRIRAIHANQGTL